MHASRVENERQSVMASVRLVEGVCILVQVVTMVTAKAGKSASTSIVVFPIRIIRVK